MGIRSSRQDPRESGPCLLVNNAGISKTVERALGSPEYLTTSLASDASLDEIRAVWNFAQRAAIDSVLRPHDLGSTQWYVLYQLATEKAVAAVLGADYSS